MTSPGLWIRLILLPLISILDINIQQNLLSVSHKTATSHISGLRSLIVFFFPVYCVGCQSVWLHAGSDRQWVVVSEADRNQHLCCQFRRSNLTHTGCTPVSQWLTNQPYIVVYIKRGFLKCDVNNEDSGAIKIYYDIFVASRIVWWSAFYMQIESHSRTQQWPQVVRFG